MEDEYSSRNYLNMCKPSLIDAHIHLDLYEPEEREKILQELDLYSVEALISVSFHLQSTKQNLEFANRIDV